MKHYRSRNQGRMRCAACIATLGLAFTIALPHAAHADDIVPPIVPDRIQVLAPNEVFLIGHATGSQNYVCVPSGTGVDWSLFTPEATLFNDSIQQVTTHFFSVNPNPDDRGAIRATWESSKDSSAVWAAATGVATFATDPAFVRPDAVAWLRLAAVGVEPGPTGGDRLSRTTFIQRINTVGGLAPTTGCTQATDLGKRAFIPYTADYVFWWNPTAR
jgi:hypothetical protein